jgi:hypothetical protein
MQTQPTASSRNAPQAATPESTPLPAFTASPSTISTQSPRGSTVSEHNEAEEASPFPGLTQWLEKLHLDPAAPRFRGETTSHGLLKLGHNMEPPPGQDAGLNMSGEHLKRRTEFWRTQPVRPPPVRTRASGSQHASGRGTPSRRPPRVRATARPRSRRTTSSGRSRASTSPS